MRTTLALILIGMLSTAPTGAQTTDEEAAVLKTVQLFFDAMAAKDADALRALMTTEGYMYAVQVSADTSAIFPRTHRASITSITGSDADFRERMFDPTVHIRDAIAVVWTPYDFHVNENFSHCGADAFTLVKSDVGWQIAAAAYTVQRDGCPDRPPLKSPADQ